MDKEEAKKKLSDLHQILKISEKKQELLSLREQVKKLISGKTNKMLSKLLQNCQSSKTK